MAGEDQFQVGERNWKWIDFP